MIPLRYWTESATVTSISTQLAFERRDLHDAITSFSLHPFSKTPNKLQTRVFRLSPQCSWDLRSSGMCCCVTGRLASDVSRQRRSLSYKEEKFMNYSTLDVETTSLSRNVRHESPSDAPPHPRSTGTSNYERLETKYPGKYLGQRRYVKKAVINCRPHSCIIGLKNNQSYSNRI